MQYSHTHPTISPGDLINCLWNDIQVTFREFRERHRRRLHRKSSLPDWLFEWRLMGCWHSNKWEASSIRWCSVKSVCQLLTPSSASTLGMECSFWLAADGFVLNERRLLLKIRYMASLANQGGGKGNGRVGENVLHGLLINYSFAMTWHRRWRWRGIESLRPLLLMMMN